MNTESSIAELPNPLAERVAELERALERALRRITALEGRTATMVRYGGHEVVTNPKLTISPQLIKYAIPQCGVRIDALPNEHC